MPKNAGKLIATVGPAAAGIVGASATASGVATVILAAASGLALGLVGLGIYEALTKDNK